jgi:hypothetical protein
MSILLAAVIATQQSNPELLTINVNRYCAAIVGIPYRSDNFTDKEWEQFQDCIFVMKQFEQSN